MAPAKRQRTSGPAQSTLSFGRSKPTTRQSAASKVAKPSNAPAKTVVSEEKLEKAVELPPTSDEILEHVEPEASPEPAEPEQEDEDEVAARAVADKQIKAYWTAKERERKAPRVHQEQLSLREKILREFDMQSKYGPSIGIKRLIRWKRARDLGLCPPIEVLAVLLREESDAPGKDKSQTSIMDELILSSRLTGEIAA